MKAHEELPRLQAARLRRMTWRDLADLKEWPPPDEVIDQLEALDLYLRRFTPMTDGKCICCGAEQAGILAGMLGTGFSWGIAHGEGACACGYPGRALHYNVGPLTRLNYVMQYHPDNLAAEREDGAA